MDARGPTSQSHTEITLRGLLLGAVITVVFMAANVYMGLKTGMTFSSSIPAAMLSMGALRLLGGSNILENNIVQTQASAAGTLCNVILILPGLVLIGHWHGFPFWQTTAVCGLGGLLGVAFSIPLRRALVVGESLPYPEGLAAAEVLRTGQGEAGAKGLRDLLTAAAAAGTIGLATTGFRLLGDAVNGAIAYGGAVFRFGTGFSLALVGVGYLVGIGACLAVLTGVVISWGVAVPVLTALGYGEGGSASEIAVAVWSEQVRLIGAGIIAVGGLWTVGSLARPILAGIGTAMASARRSGSDVPRTDRDIPITWVLGGAVLLTLPLVWLFYTFAVGGERGTLLYALVATVTLFALGFGFLMAAACGYLAGLLGSSTSPISGIGILTAMAAAVLLPLLLGASAGPEGDRFVIGMALVVAAVIVTAASIANDNLQDLKTGQLVGATPWRQQVALIVGVLIGAMVIAPLLSLLYGAYGFIGAMPRDGMDPANAMAVPQAALTTQIASGIIHRTLPWTMVLIGGALGAVLVVVEARLRKRGLTFPALTVGIGMYLPVAVEMTIVVGGVLGWLAERRLRRHVPRQVDEDEAVAGARRRGVLLASGLLVGESFVGVVIAGGDMAAGRSSSLALVGSGFAPYSTALGLAVFVGALVVLFRLTSRVVPAEHPA